MIIRDMQEKDLGEVAVLYEALSEQKSNIETMSKQFAKMKRDVNYNLVVAELNGKVVGTIMGVVCHDMIADINSFFVIENVIVDENCRGEGVGKAMLLEMERRANINECGYIFLVSGKHRTVAHKLYESLGYGEEGAKGFRKFINK